MSMSYTEFWWVLVSAVVAGVALTKILEHLWDLAAAALVAAGGRLWAHLSRR